jgi:DNA replication and repair protein RecF
LRISRLQIENFRNIGSANVEVSPILNGFWGNNGQGKTNYLEALYASAKHRSFRPYCSRKDWLPKGNVDRAPTRLEISLLDRRNFTHKISLFCGTEERWQCAWDDKRIAAGKLAARVPILAFSPDDHSLIRGGAEERRSFFDLVLADIAPGYAEIFSRFQRALKQRNEVLRRYEKDRSRAIPELSTWTRLLATESAEVSKIRQEFWPLFEAKFLETKEQLFHGEFPYLRARFHHDLSTVDKSWTTEIYEAHIRADWEKDLATGWTHRGPHRDDLLIELEEGIGSKTHASQSQARLLALALKWAHALCLREQVDEVPIFLIDDLSSELDAKHRALLLKLIRSCEGQLFISGTEDSLVDLNDFSDYTYWRVEKGLLLPQKTY